MGGIVAVLTAEKVARIKRVDRKLAVMASQTASPAEAKNAKAMLAERRKTQAALPPDERLVAIAEDIKAEWGKGVESMLTVGRMLGEAYAYFKDDFGGVKGGPKKAYGDWLSTQALPFSSSTGWKLRIAAERETEVRAIIAEHRSLGGDAGWGVVTAVNNLLAGPKPEVEKSDPVDPAYAALRAARNAILGTEDEPINAFTGMHIEDLAKSAGLISELAAAYTAAKAAR